MKNNLIFYYSFAIIIIVSSFLLPLAWLDFISKEDSIIESLSVLFFMMGSIIAITRVIKGSPIKVKKWLILWGIFCFIFMGEEASWFQRYFNYNVEQIESINKQNEFNIHNLNIFMGGSTKENLKMFTQTLNLKYIFSIIFHSQNLFRIGFWFYFLAGFFLYFKSQKFSKILTKFDYIPISKQFLISIIVILLSYFLIEFSLTGVRKRMIVESAEMFYALFIFEYVRIYLKENLAKKS